MAKDDQNYGQFLSLGLETAVGVGLGAVVGSWWDRHHQSQPWGLLIGIVVGLISGMYLFIKSALAMKRGEDKSDKTDKPDMTHRDNQ